MKMDYSEKSAEEAEEAEDLQTAHTLWRELATKHQEVYFYLYLR
jgi:hypothetical protein